MTPELLSLPNRPDAFFAVNDETAIGVLNVVKAKGLRIPDEVSICGFTNNSLAEVSDPLLTSVDQHGYELGAIAMRLLIERLNGVRDGGSYREQDYQDKSGGETVYPLKK